MSRIPLGHLSYLVPVSQDKPLSRRWEAELEYIPGNSGDFPRHQSTPGSFPFPVSSPTPSDISSLPLCSFQSLLTSFLSASVAPCLFLLQNQVVEQGM